MFQVKRYFFQLSRSKNKILTWIKIERYSFSAELDAILSCLKDFMPALYFSQISFTLGKKKKGGGVESYVSN